MQYRITKNYQWIVVGILALYGHIAGAPRVMLVSDASMGQTPASRCWKCDEQRQQQANARPVMTNDQKVDFALGHFANMVNCGIRISQDPHNTDAAVGNGLAAIMSLIAIIRETTRAYPLDCSDTTQVARVLGTLTVNISIRLHENMLRVSKS